MPPDDVRRELQRVVSVTTRSTRSDYLLSAYLHTGQKRVIDLLSLWPWIGLDDMAALLNVSSARALELLDIPLRLRLVQRVRLGGCVRYVLSDRALAFLARRDRLSAQAVLKRWSPAPWDPQAAFSWRNVTGSRGRQLARDIDHTSAVHGFLASLAREARSRGHELVMADPPHRAARRYQVAGRYEPISPDAYGIYRAGDATHHFFLEWERRAAHPALLEGKLAPYLRYYASRRVLEDHSAYPTLLVVLRDETIESHFLGIAAKEVAGAGRTTLRVLASNAEFIGSLGPLHAVWKSGPYGDAHSLHSALAEYASDGSTGIGAQVRPFGRSP